MPELAGYNDCTGCQACKFICPKRCIEMRENDAGVVLPKIDASCCMEYITISKKYKRIRRHCIRNLYVA